MSQAENQGTSAIEVSRLATTPSGRPAYANDNPLNTYVMVMTPPEKIPRIVMVIYSMDVTAIKGTVHGNSAKIIITIQYRRGRLQPKCYRACDHLTIPYRRDRSRGQIGIYKYTGGWAPTTRPLLKISKFPNEFLHRKNKYCNIPRQTSLGEMARLVHVLFVVYSSHWSPCS